MKPFGNIVGTPATPTRSLLRDARIGFLPANILLEGTTPVSAVNLATQPGQDWTIAATADFNGDGRTDILFRNTKTGGNRIWYMEGPTTTGSHDLDAVPDLNWSVTGSGVFRTSKE